MPWLESKSCAVDKVCITCHNARFIEVTSMADAFHRYDPCPKCSRRVASMSQNIQAVTVTSCPTCGTHPGGPGSVPLNATDKNCFRCGRTDLVRPIEGEIRLELTGWDKVAKNLKALTDLGLEAERARKSAKMYASAYSSDGAETE